MNSLERVGALLCGRGGFLERRLERDGVELGLLGWDLLDARGVDVNPSQTYAIVLVLFARRVVCILLLVLSVC